MSRKCRPTRIKKRAVENPRAPMQNNENASHKSLLNLPSEVLDAIVDEIAIHEMIVLARTSKAIKAYIEPHLYQKMYTNIGTPQNTEGLVNLLQTRPEILPIIKVLVLDEYHPRHTRRLLAMIMPNLWCLLVQHEEGEWAHVSEREKRALNRAVVEQPGLKNCKLNSRDFAAMMGLVSVANMKIVVFWTQPIHAILPEGTEALSKTDVCLFNHSHLSNLRLSYVDFSEFGNFRKTSLSLRHMNLLYIEVRVCRISIILTANFELSYRLDAP